jgi:hypothetical protein
MHPVDLKYIKEMVPFVSQEIVLQLKNLKPGNCIAFGSAFKVPTTMYIDLPNPRPLSNNVDLEKVWYTDTSQAAAPQPTAQENNSVPQAVDPNAGVMMQPQVAVPAAPAMPQAPAAPQPQAPVANNVTQQIIQANMQQDQPLQQPAFLQNAADTQAVNPMMLTPVG